MENKKEELRGLVKEVIQDQIKGVEDKIMEAADAQKEENAKILESNKELKEYMDSMQDKRITLAQNTGTNNYIYKGHNALQPSRNFIMDVPKELGDEAAKGMLDTFMSVAKALTTTASYAVPVEYGVGLLGLGELTSMGLSRCTVWQLDAPTFKLPNKTTRATIDTQSYGTANAAAATDLGQTTWTIDKRIGSYETLYADALADSNIDIVGMFIEPMIAEGIGQDVDDKMFNDTGAVFTTTVGADCTTDTTASGAAGIAAAGTFANLNTMYNTIEWSRGIVDAEWFGPQGMMKDVMGLLDDNKRPIFQQVPINGRPSNMLMGCRFNVTPAISNTPANGKIRLAFGSPKHYVITLRDGVTFQVNQYAGMKEGYVQIIGHLRADANLTAATAWTTLKRNDA